MLFHDPLGSFGLSISFSSTLKLRQRLFDHVQIVLRLAGLRLGVVDCRRSGCLALLVLLDAHVLRQQLGLVLPQEVLHVLRQDGAPVEGHQRLDVGLRHRRRVHQEKAKLLVRELNLVVLHLPQSLFPPVEKGSKLFISSSAEVIGQLGQTGQ